MVSGGSPQQARIGRLSADPFSEMIFRFKIRRKKINRPRYGCRKVFAAQKRFFPAFLLKAD
jgi:hypothetical protein